MQSIGDGYNYRPVIFKIGYSYPCPKREHIACCCVLAMIEPGAACSFSAMEFLTIIACLAVNGLFNFGGMRLRCLFCCFMLGITNTGNT